MDPVNSLRQAGSFSNQAVIQSSEQAHIQKELENWKGLMDGHRRMLKDQHGDANNDQILEKTDEWVFNTFLKPNRSNTAKETVGQATDTSDEDTRDYVRDIAKLFQFTMTMSMAKACGALEEKCNTLNEALRKEQEAGQKKIEALEKKQALRIRLENIQGKLANLVTTTSKLEAKEIDAQSLEDDNTSLELAIDRIKEEHKKAKNESQKISFYKFIYPISFEILDKSRIQTWLNILANEQGAYDTYDRVNALSTLSWWQSELSKKVLLAFEVALQDKDPLVRMRAAAAFTIQKHGNIVQCAASFQVLIDAVVNLKNEYKTQYRRLAILVLSPQENAKEEMVLALKISLKNSHGILRMEVAKELIINREFSDNDIQLLIDALDNKNNEYDDECRIEASEALHELAKPLYGKKLPNEALRAAKDALADPSDKVQFNVALILNKQKVPLPSIGIQIMVDVIKNKNGQWTEFRAAAISVLGYQEKLPPQALSVLEDALADQNNDVQFNAAIALSQQKVPLPSTGVQIVIDIVKNKNERRAYARAAAVHVLNHQEELPPQALSVLEDALQDEDKSVKIGAAEILSRYEYLSGSSIQILIDALDNKNNEYDDNHRMRVIVTLHELTTLYRKKLPDEALRALKDVLANQSDTVQFNAAVILNDQKVPLPSTGIQIMMDVVKNKNGRWTEFIATAISVLGAQEELPPQAFSLFENALTDQDDNVQFNAALALTQHKVPLPSTGIQIMMDAVKNENEDWAEFRANAIRVLGYQEALPPQAFSLFEDALTDQDDNVQLSAALALSEQKVQLPNTAVQIAIDVVKNKNERRENFKAIAICILSRQEKLSPPALCVLEDILEDEDEDKEVKANVALALGMHTMLSTVCMKVLLEILKDSEYDQNDRLRVISILNAEETLSPDAVSVLSSTLQDEDGKVSEAALNALSEHTKRR